MHPRRSEPGQRGLTLIEVLVALAIVAITLAAGIKAAGALTGNTQRLADTLAGQWCADNYLTRLRLERQLPPVGDGLGFFTSREPDFMLTEVHRQAQDNPIIRMSMDVREGRKLQLGGYGESRVIPRAKLGQNMVMSADQVLVGMNRTRRGMNAKMRALLGRAGHLPEVGDRLVCLRNNKEKQLLNGGLWGVEKAASPDAGRIVKIQATSQDNPAITWPVGIDVPEQFFLGTEDSLNHWARRENDEFDYGYALTTHKAQGSQWGNVLVMDESRVFKDDAAKWIYTAITRAAERVTVVQ